jgi:type III secretion protein L
MVFIVRSDSPVGYPVADSKIIRAKDVWAYREASEAVAAGEKRRDTIVAAGLAAFEAEQRRGFQVGQEAARIEQTSNMIEIISQTVDYFSKVEAQLVDLVMDAVRRIANDFDEREKVIRVVRNSLAIVRNQRQVLVKVNPGQVFTIREQVQALKEAFPTIENLEVIADSALLDDACVIESDIGRVEASMSGQIEALRSTFEKVFSASRDTKRNSIE